jgi:vesicle-fusing ATPase
MAGISDDVENLRVNRDDFINALEEVHPAFGVSEEELQQVIQNGIIHYNDNVKASSFIIIFSLIPNMHPQELLRTGQLFVEQVRTSKRTPLVSILLHGPSGSGKTALGATIAQESQFPFIKLISPDSMVGFNENQKVAAISKVFADSYKSPESVIVVDNVERLLGAFPVVHAVYLVVTLLLDWAPLGSRFSNAVLQALLVLFARRPPKVSQRIVAQKLFD